MQTNSYDKTDQLCANTVRLLAVDAVQAANSGHPGLPPWRGGYGHRSVDVLLET